MPVSSKFDPNLLHVVCCISNPVRYNSRYALYKRFNAEMKAAGANLLTVEAAFGDRVHEITPPEYGKHLQLRTNTELWHKENALNLGIATLPGNADYIAWVDADVSFLNPNWITETIEALQHYPIVQMFESAVDETHTGAVHNVYQSFASSFVKGLPLGPGAGGYYGSYWHSGFAWAATREAFEELGGLPDFCIVGSADHHLANALIGRVEVSLPAPINKNYSDMVFAIQDRAKAGHIMNNIGYVPGSLAHHFHGPKTKRGYQSRWSILQKWDFDPILDIARDAQGLWQLTKRGLRMQNDLRAYFRSRDEDDIREA
jgi:hypothetical protein